MKKMTLLVAIFCAVNLWAEPQNGVVYVKPGANGTGASWADAMGNIQSAITQAKATDNARKDVWVAAGEFALAAPINMQDSVNLYGGFAGTESTIGERKLKTNGKAWDFENATVLKGSVSRLIQTAVDMDMPTVVDGFTITNGDGTGSATTNNGGGVLLRQNLILQRSIVKNCNTVGAGGGVMINGGGTINRCLIKDNTQTTGANGGGGVFCNTSSNGFEAFIENSDITGNRSSVRGAGLGIQGNTKVYVRNCKIYNNIAKDGTTDKQGAGIYTNSVNNEIVNNVIYNNSGANTVYLQAGTFVNNTVVKNVGGVYIAVGNAAGKVINNIVWGCVTGTSATSITGVTATALPAQNNATYNPVNSVNYITSGNIQFSSNASNGDVESPAEGTVGSGPKFTKVSPFIGAVDATTLSSADYQELVDELDNADWSLLYASPCVNAGQAQSGLLTSDITGANRPQGFPVAKFDIGAYELPYYPVTFADYNVAKGKIYNENGLVLTKDTTLGFARGENIVLYFFSNPYRVFLTASNNGGLTYTGQKTEITSELDGDGKWTSHVSYSFQISVEWDNNTSLRETATEQIRCQGVEKGIRISEIPQAAEVAVYNIGGALVYRGVSAGSTLFVPLSQGIYVVRAADFAHKVIVK